MLLISLRTITRCPATHQFKKLVLHGLTYKWWVQITEVSLRGNLCEPLPRSQHSRVKIITTSSFVSLGSYIFLSLKQLLFSFKDICVNTSSSPGDRKRLQDGECAAGTAIAPRQWSHFAGRSQGQGCRNKGRGLHILQRRPPTNFFIIKLLLWFFVCLFWFGLVWFVLFRATPIACGGSQARGRIGAAAPGLCHSHGTTRSEPYLWPTSQVTQCWILNSLREARDRTQFLMDAGWFHYHWATTGPP